MWVHIFNKALRIHDNQALLEAAASCRMLIPLFIFDEKEVRTELLSVNRLDAILQSLVDLNESLREIGSQLYVAIGDPLTIVEAIFNSYPIQKVTYERDNDPSQGRIDLALVRCSLLHGVEQESYCLNTLFDINQVLPFIRGWTTALSINEFLKSIEKCGNPSEPVAAPTYLPPGPTDVVTNIKQVLPTIPTLQKFVDEYGYSYEENHIYFRCGETHALEMLPKILSADSISPWKSSGVSPWLAMGGLSVRLLYSKLDDISERHPGSLVAKESIRFV